MRRGDSTSDGSCTDLAYLEHDDWAGIAREGRHRPHTRSIDCLIFSKTNARSLRHCFASYIDNASMRECIRKRRVRVRVLLRSLLSWPVPSLARRTETKATAHAKVPTFCVVPAQPLEEGNAVHGACLRRGHESRILPSNTMSSATQRVLETIELIEHIISKLPVDDLLRARHVSQLWMELVERSKRYRDICTKPYLCLTLNLPTSFSMAAT